jgi:hypothetical protein
MLGDMGHHRRNFPDLLADQVAFGRQGWTQGEGTLWTLQSPVCDELRDRVGGELDARVARMTLLSPALAPRWWLLRSERRSRRIR